MNTFLIVTLLAVCVSAQLAVVNAQGWESIANAAVQSLISLHSWGNENSVNYLNAPCKSSIKGRVSSFKWKWDAKFVCYGRFNGLKGSSRGSSGRTSAVRKAVQDFTRQAISQGIVTAAEVAGANGY